MVIDAHTVRQARIPAGRSGYTRRSAPGGEPIAGGDFTVVDASPFPTSKSPCKDGGQEQFGFRNQGQCVGFATGELDA